MHDLFHFMLGIFLVNFNVDLIFNYVVQQTSLQL